MTMSSVGTPKEWLLQKLHDASGPVHPKFLLMSEELPSGLDSISVQFEFWRMVAAGEIELDQNRRASLGSAASQPPEREALSS